MSAIIKTTYEGKYLSTTKSPLNKEPIAANAVQCTPVDLLMSAYGSCLLGTIDYAAHLKQFEIKNAQTQIEYQMSEDKSKVGKISIKIFFSDDYTEEQKNVIEFAAKNQCHVGSSLDSNIAKVYEFLYNHK